MDAAEAFVPLFFFGAGLFGIWTGERERGEAAKVWKKFTKGAAG